MSEKEKKIFETFAFIIPKISESDKNYFHLLEEEEQRKEVKE